MGEKGTVIDIKDGLAVISFNRTEACAKCKACMAGFTEAEMVLKASNNIGAKTGDSVIIELQDKAFMIAAVIMYAIPLFVMLVGFFAGQAISPALGVNGDAFSFFFGIGLLALSYITIRLLEKRIKSLSMFLPYVAEIVEV